MIKLKRFNGRWSCKEAGTHPCRGVSKRKKRRSTCANFEWGKLSWGRHSCRQYGMILARERELTYPEVQRGRKVAISDRGSYSSLSCLRRKKKNDKFGNHDYQTRHHEKATRIYEKIECRNYVASQLASIDVKLFLGRRLQKSRKCYKPRVRPGKKRTCPFKMSIKCEKTISAGKAGRERGGEGI